MKTKYRINEIETGYVLTEKGVGYSFEDPKLSFYNDYYKITGFSSEKEAEEFIEQSFNKQVLFNPLYSYQIIKVFTK